MSLMPCAATVWQLWRRSSHYGFANSSLRFWERATLTILSGPQLFSPLGTADLAPPCSRLQSAWPASVLVPSASQFLHPPGPQSSNLWNGRISLILRHDHRPRRSEPPFCCQKQVGGRSTENRA